jgi:hypothetical protein
VNEPVIQRGRVRIESIDGGTRVTIGPPRSGSQWFNLFVVTFAVGPISLSPSVALSAELISGHEHFHAAFLALLCTLANKAGQFTRWVITFDYGGKKVDVQRYVSDEEREILLYGPFRTIAANDSKTARRPAG